MLYAGLDLSRKRLDVHVLDERGKTVATLAVAPDADALRTLAGRLLGHDREVTAVIESMNGARFVHDQLELAGWDVEIADAVHVKGLAPLAAKTDRIDAWVLAELARRDLVPAIWLPDPVVRGELRAGPLPTVPGASPDLDQEPDPRDPDDVRPPGAGGRPVRQQGPRAALGDGGPGALGDHPRDQPQAGRPAGRGDRRLRAGAAPPGCRPPRHPAADDDPGRRLGARLHDRLGARRHQPVRHSQAAGGLHRAVPPGPSVGCP